MIYRRFLNIALACVALTAGAVQGNDDAVLGAYEAYRAGDAARLERHARALEHHALAPWIDYWRLRLRIQEAAHPEIERLARVWAADRPRGWPQIEAVLTKLRTEYVLDRDAAAPPEHPAPVLWFLTESRRGPDYLFATAAALLLRSLDYPTRVCLGYYAAPDAYDPETAHMPVKASDLHFWPEVLLRDGQWLVVEPTPGY